MKFTIVVEQIYEPIWQLTWLQNDQRALDSLH